MKVTLKDYTKNPEVVIGENAAICYDADTSEAACIRRANKCKDSGHLATMRFAYATFNVSGISRICSHQLVRIAHAGILQRSQRYTADSKVEYINPPVLSGCPDGFVEQWEEVQLQASRLYHHAINNKLLRKEDARYILPQSCTTELNLCLNFQGWQDVLKNRTDKAAQWEVREVALEIERQLKTIAPNLF